MPSCDSSVEVTLQSIDGLDEFAERRFVLSPNTTVPVGRSSKNHSKKLMSGPDNAFIDSPVISREHARFAIADDRGPPAVYLTDDGSMHGTFINNQPLQRRQSYCLCDGDTLQFGTNVVRDQDSFIAKKFRFRAEIAPALSRGFSVPDSGDEDEDEIDSDPLSTSSPRAASYGSMTNPVNVDDFEDAPDQMIGSDDDDAAGPEPSSPKAEGSAASESNRPPATASVSFASSIAQEAGRPLADHDHNRDQDDGYEAQGEETHNESKADPPVSDEEGGDEDNDSNLSQAGSMDNSNIDTGSESEESDDDNVDDDPLPRPRIGFERFSLANDENSAPPAHTFSSPHTLQATSSSQTILQPSSSIGLTGTVSPQDIQKQPEVVSNSIFQPFSPAVWDSLPPRPIAPKAYWGPPGPDAHGTFLRGELNHFNPYNGPFPGNSYTHRMDYLGQVLNSEPACAPLPQPTLSMGLPTPPVPIPSEITPFVREATPIAPQANRRNGVSIPELVEETPQEELPQEPPTPTSVDTPKSLKRKAESFDEDETEAVTEVVIDKVAQGTEAAVPEAVPANEEQVPKRRRTTLASVATNAASFIAGGLFAVGALVLLPESAFS